MNKNHYLLMAHYNQWMNNNIYDVCDNISDSERKKDLGAFFKSIHSTLNHIIYGDLAWLHRFKELPLNVKLGKDLFENYEELKLERIKVDKEIIEWVQNLNDSWLESDFEFTSMVDGKKRNASAWVYVSHLFNHQTHHRGQITNLIKQLGLDPGVTDIPWMPSLDKLF